MMKKDKVIVEKIFNVNAKQAWLALTNNEHLQKWYFQLTDFKAKTGFKFDFTGGPDEGPHYLHLCEVVEVIEEKKIAYTWRYDNYPGNSLVCWEIIDKGEQVLIRITHTGLETFEENGENFTATSFTAGWNYFVHEALNTYLETKYE